MATRPSQYCRIFRFDHLHDFTECGWSPLSRLNIEEESAECLVLAFPQPRWVVPCGLTGLDLGALSSSEVLNIQDSKQIHIHNYPGKCQMSRANPSLHVQTYKMQHSFISEIQQKDKIHRFLNVTQSVFRKIFTGQQRQFLLQTFLIQVKASQGNDWSELGAEFQVGIIIMAKMPNYSKLQPLINREMR